MQQLLGAVAHWLRPHLALITFAFMAMVLILYGGRIHGEVKKIIQGYSRVVRIPATMLVSLGYGWVLLNGAGLIERGLRWKSGIYLGPVVLAILLLLAILSDKGTQA